MACSERAFGGCNPRLGLLQVRGDDKGLHNFPVVCEHCTHAACAAVCPVDAITRDQETGRVLLDRERCTGCGLCVQHCPLGVIVREPGKKGKAVKCDHCAGAPRCVAACPQGALEWIEREEASHD
jgi:Fe-S-cluster-containing hydrogenase component 2